LYVVTTSFFCSFQNHLDYETRTFLTREIVKKPANSRKTFREQKVNILNGLTDLFKIFTSDAKTSGKLKKNLNGCKTFLDFSKNEN
jgi:hypothetical protein